MTVVLAVLAATALAAALIELPGCLPRRRRRARRDAAAAVRPDPRLQAAGLDRPVGWLRRARRLAAAAALLPAAPLALVAPGRTAPVVLAGLPAAAAALPSMLVRARARRRGRALAEELPDVLGLLLGALDAGLPPRRAAAETARHARGLLAAELHDAVRRTALGERWSEALARLESRCPQPGVVALARALRRAHDEGAPPLPALQALAADARAARAAAARERAARAAPQIQLVVALLLVPAVLLLVAAVLLPALA